MTKTHVSTDTSIRTARTADLAVASRTLASAFQDDPVFSWCIPDPGRRVELLPSFFKLFATAVVPYGDSELTADGAGVALWVPAGEPPVPEHEASAFEATIVDLAGPDMQRIGSVMAMLDEHHPTEPVRFLWFVGVETAAQGRGLGSALLRSKLTNCDRDGIPAYLDATSEHNRRLYERHGFGVTAERSVDGSPPLWAMWRDPL